MRAFANANSAAGEPFAVAAKTERREAQPLPEEHVEADEQQHGAEQPFAAGGDELLDAEEAGSPVQYGDQQHPQRGVGYGAAEGIEQAVAKDAAPVVEFLADEADRGDVRGQRAGRYGREQSQHESRQYGSRFAVQQRL